MAAPDPSPTSSVVAALSVHAESLVAGARVLVVGGRRELEPHLGELGARSVHLYDLDAGDLDVRDGAFDLAIVPDVGVLQDPQGVIRRLRRVVAAKGSVLALGRAVTEDADSDALPEVAPAAVGYAQLYDLFALQFEQVVMSGVLPFTGVVFAELGQDEDVAVSVDTRLAPPSVPGVFVVLASREPRELDPYAIVQVPPASRTAAPVARGERDSEAAVAAAQLRADLLGAQLEELRARVVSPSSSEPQDRRAAQRFEVLAAERDAATTRAEELEGILSASQQALATLEQRLASAEQQSLERDDMIAALRGELDALRSAGVDMAAPDPELLAELALRAERAEAALALNVADLAHVAEAHATETASLEAQLRDRARVVAAMEKELGRREQLVRELVTSLEEAREQNGAAFAPPPAASFDTEELGRLRRKLDELSLEIARREGELVAQQWRIEELEGNRGGETRVSRAASGASAGPDASRELAQVRDELDALRQALTQEHAARVAAESGEELTRARAELARQAALLEQMRGRGSHADGQ